MVSFYSVTTTFFLIAAASLGTCKAQPEYSQQCRDDAGPPFEDDGSTFNGGSYHTTSSAEAVLVDGECAGPVADACESRGDPLTAYLEGPTSCTNGWFCRILLDENWDPQNLIGDLNFGYCNSTESANSDQSGHCHGGSVDSTFYWWVRDHWFRGYNGRLRCCCGWTTLSSANIVNRCDYRREVTQDENLEDCRDANEDHNLSYEGDCADVGAAIEEDDGECWEVLRFGQVGDVEGGDGYEECCDYESGSNDGEDDDEEEEKGGIFKRRKMALKLVMFNKLHHG